MEIERMRTAITTALLLAALALAAPAQETPPPGAEAKERLQELAWLVGTWKGAGQFEGQAYDSRIDYEWAMDGAFIESRYEATMGGQVAWRDRTMLGWDRVKGKFTSFTFGVDGSIGWGDYEPQTEKDTWVAVGSIPGDPLFEKSRSIMKRLGPDKMEMTIQTWKDESWVDFMTGTFDREAAAKTD